MYRGGLLWDRGGWGLRPFKILHLPTAYVWGRCRCARTMIKHNFDAEWKISDRVNHLHESMHSQLVYSDFRPPWKKVSGKCNFLSFLQKNQSCSKHLKNENYRFLGVKSNIFKILLMGLEGRLRGRLRGGVRCFT